MEQNLIKPKKNYKYIAVLAVVIMLGFVAGILGELFTRTYLSNSQFFSDLYFTDATNLGQKELIIREPRKVVVELDSRLAQLKNDVQPSVLGIFKKRKFSQNFLDNIFAPADFTGQALALTSDGWLMATQDAITRSLGELVIYYNNKAYDLEKIIRDEKTGIVFLKINVQNLPVVKLADVQKATPGEQLFVFQAYYGELNLANIVSKSYQPIFDKYDLVNSSESLIPKVLINKNFSSALKGAAVFNLQGEVLGFLVADNEGYNQIVPVNYLNPIVNQVLKGDKISRPYLGINYINLSRTYNLKESEGQETPKGAMIWSNKNGVAINEDSPLFGKLAKGDIILSLENQQIDAENDLSLLLLGYKSGQEIRLKYLRDNKETEISVIIK
ncbi:MAG: PDZ domain-containing protein [Candidatus Parcubacteria bacterium]|nr:PDZ domain-containing protein [Candidatus Parcubacteria bacterium]